MSKHINVTIKYVNDDKLHDLRVPTDMTVQQFIQVVTRALKISLLDDTNNKIRVVNKDLVLFDTQRIAEYPVSTGDIIEIL